MALTFDVKKVKNHKDVTTAWRIGNEVYLTEAEIPEGAEAIEIWHPMTEAIVFRTMAVGFGSVSEKNICEFYTRSMLFDRITDTHPLWVRGEKTHLTMEMLQTHIGLTTNVSDETRTAWMKRIVGYEYDNLMLHAKHEHGEVKVA
jgi:hypothetical protein